MQSIQELSSLKDRRALVTGAAGHLGNVIAETLAEMGADLCLVDKDEIKLNDVAEMINGKYGVSTDIFVCNLEDSKDRSELILRLNESKLPLNILVNNAAFVGTTNLEGWNVPFKDQSLETWRRAHEVNLTAVFHLCQGLHTLLENSLNSSIINISSIYGSSGPDWKIYEGTQLGNPAAYGVSKGGLNQLTRWLSTVMAPNVRVNAVSPGGIYRFQPESFVKNYAERTLLGRMATEVDLKGIIAYLASDLSSYVTGQNISVDGGWNVV
jgi:NAD(P)-dependent dehydrogenase (short-subunit alcohol dehydrogenase family)